MRSIIKYTTSSIKNSILTLGRLIRANIPIYIGGMLLFFIHQKFGVWTALFCFSVGMTTTAWILHKQPSWIASFEKFFSTEKGTSHKSIRVYQVEETQKKM